MEDDDDGESALAAVGCVTAIRRVLDSIKNDKNLLLQLKPIIYPILLHGLTPEGMDAIQDGLDCLALLIYHGGKDLVGQDLWTLYPQMLLITSGTEKDVDGGWAYEFMASVVVCCCNFITKDPQNFLSVGPEQSQTYFE